MCVFPIFMQHLFDLPHDLVSNMKRSFPGSTRTSHDLHCNYQWELSNGEHDLWNRHFPVCFPSEFFLSLMHVLLGNSMERNVHDFCQSGNVPVLLCLWSSALGLTPCQWFSSECYFSYRRDNKQVGFSFWFIVSMELSNLQWRPLSLNVCQFLRTFSAPP